MLNKTIKIVDKSIDRIVLIVSLLLFLICIYAMIDAVMVYYNANDQSVLKYKPHGKDDAAVLRELSDDAVAWLTVDDTNIDYPIMQGKNNSEYLNKNPYGDYSLSGSIFLDSRCDGKFKDEYALLYGHHMDYGAMFGALDEFIKPDYFSAHRTGKLVTVGGEEYSITFFSAAKAPADEDIIFDPPNTTNKKLLKYLKKKAAIYEEPRDQGHIIALSTCQSAENIERMLVFGVLSK
jgi:sortase B